MDNLTGIYQVMRMEGLFLGIGGIFIIIASLPLKKRKKSRKMKEKEVKRKKKMKKEKKNTSNN